MIGDEAAARAWLREQVDCDAACLDRLERLACLLREENGRQNLVSAGSLAQVWTRHIADSAQLLGHADGAGGTWLDLGTGAGFPGLVIAALRQEQRVVLVESRARRAEWLSSAAAELGLNHVTVVPCRLERVAPFVADVISARAFAPLTRLLAAARPFSGPETLWLLPKGRNGFKELGETTKAIRAMFHVEPSLTDPAAAILVGRGTPPIPQRSEAR